MGMKNFVKIASLVILTLLATSCLEKANKGSGNKDAANKLWQWDDVQKSWLYDGSLFAPKVNDSPASMWKGKEKAILLQVDALKAMNMFDNAPKALQMKVFQLSDPKAFLQAAKSSSGLKHLLVTEQIDPAILGMERLIILPGTNQTVSLDREEGARYIGIVLGYANLNQEKIFRFIPLITLDDNSNTEEAPAEDSSLLSSLVGRKAKQSKVKMAAMLGHPATLKINLFLESSGIDKLDVSAE